MAEPHYELVDNRDLHPEEPTLLLPTSESKATLESSEHTKSGDDSSPASSTIKPVKTLDWWWLEIASTALSVAGLFAVVALFRAVDGKPQSKWGLHFQPNTLASILSTIIRTALLFPLAQGLGQLKWIHFSQRPQPVLEFEIFDSASRAPAGALQLLWHINFRARIAALGSFLVLGCLTFSFFLQQSIQFSLKSSPVAGSDPAIIRYASVWNDTPTSPDSRQISLIDSSGNFAPAYGSLFAEAFLRGLALPQLSWPLSCPSAYCKWETYTSLGVCSDCVDVTSSTKTTCATPDQNNQTVCYYTTPGGITIVAHNRTEESNIYGTLFNITSNDSTVLENVINPGISSLIHFAAIKFKENNTSFSLGYVAECSVEYCARTYSNASSQNGTFSSQMTQTTLQFDQLGNSNDNIYITLRVPLNGSTGMEGNTSFLVNTYSHQLLLDSLNILSESSSEIIPFTEGNAQSHSASFTSTVFSSSPDLGKTVRDLAWTLSAYIANTSTGLTQNGTAYQDEVYIQISWPWIIPPAVLVLGTIVFLVMTVLETRSRGVRSQLWKCSSLAILFHTPQGMSEDFSKVKKLSDMVQTAKTVQGQLVGDSMEIRVK